MKGYVVSLILYQKDFVNYKLLNLTCSLTIILWLNVFIIFVLRTNILIEIDIQLIK